MLAAVINRRTRVPFRVEVAVEFRLGSDGLDQTVTVRNIGTDALRPGAPGPHPYLVAGEGRSR